MKVYLVDILGSTVKAFADRTRAEQYVECLIEEWDDETELPVYFYSDIDIVELDIEK